MAKYTLDNGPYPLTETAIDKRVPIDEKGAYALGPLVKNGTRMQVLRVGRSDSDLNARLKAYLDDPEFADCTHFFFDLYTTKKAAFDAECFLYHDYDPPLNENHPGRPRGTDHCCPVNDKDECPPCADED
jgi:hypothetical protein